MAALQVTPLRPIEDFLLESARFQIPNIKDPKRWANRVLNNLLYYQTNYFMAARSVFLLTCIFYPVQMVCGFIAISVAFGCFVYCTRNRWKARRFKRDHPIISVIVILLSVYLLMYMVGAVEGFMFGIAFPLLLILMHASFRMRGIKNKVTNRLENAGLMRTPMGIILEGLCQEQEQEQVVSGTFIHLFSRFFTRKARNQEFSK